jgi:hypothetical protein
MSVQIHHAGGGGAGGGGNLEITFDASTTTAGQDYDRTSGGTYETHRAYIFLTCPIKLNQVLWDVSSAKTYTLKIYRGWGLVDVFANLGDYVASGRTADAPWSAGDVFMPLGRYVFELSWTGGAVVDDNNANSPNRFSFFDIEYSQYNTTFDANFSAAMKLVAYLGTEAIV